MEATKTKTKTATSNPSSATSLVNVPRVSRVDLCKRLICALDEDGLVTLCADKGYGAGSIVREAANYLKVHKHRVLLYNFSSVESQKLSASLKGLLKRINSDQKTYLFLLDFPLCEEEKLRGVLTSLKNLQKRTRLCIAGSSRLVLFDEMLQEQMCGHTTFFARDLLVGEEEYKFFSCTDEETYQDFLRATNGIISLAENRYQAAHRRAWKRENKPAAATCSSQKDVSTRRGTYASGTANGAMNINKKRSGTKNVSPERYSEEELLMFALHNAVLQKEKELCCVLALMREGSVGDLKDLGLKVTPEMLFEIERDAPVFGMSGIQSNALLRERMQKRLRGGSNGHYLTERCMPPDEAPTKSKLSADAKGQRYDRGTPGGICCHGTYFALPQNVLCPAALVAYCAEEFEETFLAVITRLLDDGRSTQAHALLKATVLHKKIQRYILEHAGSIYEHGGAEILLQVGAFFEEQGKAPSRCESEFLKLARALSKKRSCRWILESGITAELLTATEEGKRPQIQYLILLYEVAHQYKSVRQSVVSAHDSYASLEHYDPRLPQELRSLASFLFIRRAFLQNDMRRAIQRAEIARIDCNYTSFSGALLTLALFEVELLETAPSPDSVFPGNLDEVPWEIKSALEFLHQPGYETIYEYERCFLELFLNFVESDALASRVREVQSLSVENNDDVMVVITLCALAYNDLLEGHLQKSLGTAEEATFLAKKAHIPLLQEITSVLEEALRPAEKDGTTKEEHKKEQRSERSYSSAGRAQELDSTGSRDDICARPASPVLEIGSTPDLIRFILRQTKRKMLLKRESSLGHPAISRTCALRGARADNTQNKGVSFDISALRTERFFEKHHASEDSASEGIGALDALPPSFLAAPFSLNGLWTGLLHLIIEKVEDVGAELLPELPVQWRNALVEKSRGFRRRNEERASRTATCALVGRDGATSIFAHSHPFHTSQLEASSLRSPVLEKTTTEARCSMHALGSSSFLADGSSGRSCTKTSSLILTSKRTRPFSTPPFDLSLAHRAQSAGEHMEGALGGEERAMPLVYPILHISLLDNFSIRLGDVSLPDTAWRRESSKNLLILLAAAGGHTLSRQVLFHKLWPELNYQTHVNNLYTALSDLRKVLMIRGDQKRRNVPYIISRHGMLSLNTEVVEVDVDALFTSTKKVIHPATSDSVKRVKALEVLILFGRGPKFPCGFSQTSEADYLKSQLAREFATATIEGALAAWRMGYFRDATKLALAAVAASQLQEDIVADAMKMLIDMGKTEEVHRMYRVFKNHYKKLYGTDPEGEIKRLYQSISSKKEALVTSSATPGQTKQIRLAA